MSIGKKATAKPVNMDSTFYALNNAATVPATAVPEQVQPAQQIQIQQVPPVQAPVQIQAQPEPQKVSSAGIPTVEQIQAQVAKQENKPAVTSSTEKTMISLRLLKNDKEKFQEFFKSCGLSFTDGLYMAADFIEREVENGRLQMSKSGIQYK